MCCCVTAADMERQAAALESGAVWRSRQCTYSGRQDLDAGHSSIQLVRLYSLRIRVTISDVVNAKTLRPTPQPSRTRPQVPR